jgi:hypothetical protein
MAHEMNALEPAPEGPFAGRNETELECCDRNLVELLQEVRVVQTGVQVLFAFLLMAPLTPYFHHLDGRQHAEYFASFALAGLAAFVLIAPTAYHRVLFRRGDKRYLVTIANRLTIAGLGAVGVSMAGATMFVTDVLFGPWLGITAGALSTLTGLLLWVLLPLARRRGLSNASLQSRAEPSLRSIEHAGPDRPANASRSDADRAARREYG